MATPLSGADVGASEQRGTTGEDPANSTATAPPCSASPTNTPPWESGLTGPFDQWPTGLGFERFYGNVIGESDQFSPVVHDNTTPAHPSKDPNYYYQTDIADKAISWIKTQKSLNPDKPFFVYYAAQGMHDPVQLPAGMARQVQRQVRSGLGRIPRRNPGAPERTRHRPTQHPAHAQARHRAGLGHPQPRREEGLHPPSGTVRGVRRADRPRDRPGRTGRRRHGRDG